MLQLEYRLMVSTLGHTSDKIGQLSWEIVTASWFEVTVRSSLSEMSEETLKVFTISYAISVHTTCNVKIVYISTTINK